jgi:hypothetical protein
MMWQIFAAKSVILSRMSLRDSMRADFLAAARVLKR